MARYISLRVLYFIPTVVVALFIVFTLAKLAPGDPVTLLLAKMSAGGNGISAQQRDSMVAAYGLNKPFLVQFGDYVVHVFTFDFGRSIATNRPINDLFARALPISLQLGGAALFLLIFIGIPLGTLAAVKSQTWIDHLIVGVSIVLRAIPVFVLGPILLAVLVLWLHVTNVPHGFQGLFLPQTILPVFLLAAPAMSLVIQETRAGVLDVLHNDYVRTAQAKGVPPLKLIVRHVLRNALIPVVTSLGVLLAYMVTSTVFIDRMFSIPGFGSTYWNAIPTLDYPVLLAATAFVTVAIAASNLLVDVLYGFLDPRIRFTSRNR
ncbi:MAG: ABC transporter permease [Chloroflexota bacterium]|nr:ABC transporter permease [Chloroflexota bacterium]